MFKNARITLTAWYLLIIMLVSLTFSIVIFKGISREIDRFERVQRCRIERRLIPLGQSSPNLPTANPELLQETKERVILILLLINGTILFVSGGLGYILAGKTLAPIQEMMDEQNRFISDASHELRTPLTSLKTSMEVSLRDKGLKVEDARRLITESIDDVNKLQSLSEELLQLAQYEMPDGHARLETVLLNSIIKGAIHKIEPTAKQKRIQIEYDEKKLEVKGNKYGLTDLVLILLDNAVKYSPENSKVLIRTDKIDGSLFISIKDRGIGVDEKDLPRIFDRFYRADRARTRSTAGGYGLGLSIAKKIVEIHNGSIGIKSKLGKGSTFTIRLPIRS